MTDTRTHIWPCFLYDDARAAIRFLVDVLGFTEAVVYGDGDRVDHAELRWPEGGGVMLGVGAAYVVTDDPDMIHERVVAAGGNIVHPLQDEDYGSRGFTCRDPEGVHWSFGTYSGT